MSTEADPNPTDASSDVTIRADLSGAGKAPAVDPIEVGDGGNTTRTIRADLQQPGNPQGAPAAKSPQAKLGLPAGGIPGYAISRRLGAGGMGQVYEATRESDGCAVALKLLRADAIADPEFRERFQREAEVMQQVSHANVVGYMGAGEHEGWLYLATELMRDGDLDRYLKRRGQLFEKDALTLVLKAAEGIAAIHAAGLIHRDIKPQNIFLDHKATDTSDLKVGDLGMARHESGEDRMTMTGTACGTPAYMSPEQLRGEADIDHRADGYALGVMLYTLLAGREPFVGDTAFTVSHAVLREQAPDLRRFCQVSSTTAAIVRQSMRKERADRYQTVSDFIDDCRRALAGERPLHAGLVEPAAPVSITTTTQAGSTLGAGGGGGLGGRIGDIAATITGAGPVVKVVLIGIVIVAGLSMLPGILERKTRTASAGEAALVEVKPIRDGTGTGIRVTIGGVPLALRWCPPGSFTMGSSEDEPGHVFWEAAHTVTLNQGTWMLAGEVTNSQWTAVMGVALEGAAEFPRVNVSRTQAEAFCETLSKRLGVVARLPSDAEWEHACRAGTSAAFSVDPTSEALASDPALLASWKTQPADGHPNEQTLTDAFSEARRRGLGPRQSASGTPNAWGLFDCHGNVQEWCLDRWNHRDAWSSDSQVDPVESHGPLTVVRGGSWMHPVIRARSSARDAMDGDVGWEWIGFRFVIEGGPIPQPLPSE